jgi:hypothetical protein
VAPGPRPLVTRGYPWDTAPRVAGGLVFCVRSHPRDVSRRAACGDRCPSLRPLHGRPSPPPASLTGCAVPLPYGGATPGPPAWPLPSARVRLTTGRDGHRRGADASVDRRARHVCRATVQISRAWPSSLCGAGAFEPLQRRACHDPSCPGFTSVVQTRHAPPSFPCAAPRPDDDCVLETPPWPVTPPPCGTRGHDSMAGSPLPSASSRTHHNFVSQ